MKSFPVPPDKIGFIEQLIEEIGGLPDFEFHEDHYAEQKYNNHMASDAEQSITEAVRYAALVHYGFEPAKWKPPYKQEGDDGRPKFLNEIIIGRDKRNEVIFRGKLQDSPHREVVKDLLKDPPNKTYDWYHAVYWNLGPLNKLKYNKKGCLINTETKVFLFRREVEKLREGQEVTPRYWSGISSLRFYMNELDTFGIDRGNLFRVYAYLID